MNIKIVLLLVLIGGVLLHLLVSISRITHDTKEILVQLKSLAGNTGRSGKEELMNSDQAEPQDLNTLLAMADFQCEPVRKGRLDLDANGDLVEVVPGKLTPFKVPLRLPTVEEVEQRKLRHKAQLLSPVDQSPRFKGMEFGCFSQNTEDGILLAIFWAIGVTNKRVVEICSGVGWENNAATLVLHFGFDGILMDGGEDNVKRARKFFAAHPGSVGRHIRLVREFITAENVNDLIRDNGFEGEIDLFSLDMDGVDYWIWDAIEVVRPRVVVVETQEVWGWRDYETRPYRPDHVSRSIPEMGASIMAFVHLAESRGYRLVGCIELGFNAFFVRKDLGVEEFGDAYNPKGCFWHWDAAWTKVIEDRRAYAKKFDWVDPRTTTREKSVADAKTGGS